MATRNRTARRARANKVPPSPHHQAALVRELQMIEFRLEDICAVIVAAIEVLKAQAADADTDVARCLMRGALEPIRAQMERLQAIGKGASKRHPR